MTTLQATITQQIRDNRKRHNKIGGRTALTCSPEMASTHLESIRVKLGVTINRLSKMIDNPYPNHVYDWFRGSRGVSAFYWLRIVHLLLLQMDNKLDLATFDGRTYWDSVGMGDTRE